MGDGPGRYRYQQDRVESALVEFCDYGLSEEFEFNRDKEVSSVQQLAVL